MTNSPGTPRPWQVIAEEAAHEKNSDRLLKLTRELEQAFEARDKELNKESESTITGPKSKRKSA